jgi:hypothetical protein
VPTETNYGPGGNEVLIMNTKNEDRPTSFFAQPGILAGNFTIKLIFFKRKLQIPKLFHSRHWWSRRWIVVCDFSSDVHRLSNAKEGRRLICIGRAEEIAASKLLYQES